MRTDNLVKHGYGEFYLMNGVAQKGTFEFDKLVQPFEGKSFYEVANLQALDDTEPLPEHIDLTSTSKSNLLMAASQSKTLQSIPVFIADLVDSKQWNEIQSHIARNVNMLKQIFVHYCKFGVEPDLVTVMEPAVPENATLHETPRSSATRPLSQGSMRSSVATPSIERAASVSIPVELKHKVIKFAKYGELSMMQFWKFAKDMHLISSNRLCFAEVDRAFLAAKTGVALKHANQEVDQLPPVQNKQQDATTHVHAPDQRMRFREFVEALVRMAFAMTGDQLQYTKSQAPTTSERVQYLLEGIIIPQYQEAMQAEQDGYLFLRDSPQYQSVITQYQSIFETLFVFFSCAAKDELRQDTNPLDSTMTVRQFLRMVKQLQLVDKVLTLHKILGMIDQQDKNELVVDREIIFDEFVELNIQCAMIKYGTSKAQCIQQWIDHCKERASFL